MDFHVVAGHEALRGGGEPGFQSHGCDDKNEQDLTRRAERQFSGPRGHGADNAIRHSDRPFGRPDREPRDVSDGITDRQDHGH